MSPTAPSSSTRHSTDRNRPHPSGAAQRQTSLVQLVRRDLRRRVRAFDEPSKVTMTLLMWVGRLEILPVLLLLRQLLAPVEPLVLGQLDE
jgi:hypothetical protein